MRLHNQTKKPLRFHLGSLLVECDGWGGVDIPDQLVPFCERRGLPLGPIPVPPERRARQKVADAEQGARSDEVTALRDAVREAQESESAAKSELEKTQLALGEAGAAILGLEAKVAELGEDIGSLESDKAAAESLLTETAAKATESEERALRAEALAEKPKAE